MVLFSFSKPLTYKEKKGREKTSRVIWVSTGGQVLKQKVSNRASERNLPETVLLDLLNCQASATLWENERGIFRVETIHSGRQQNRKKEWDGHSFYCFLVVFYPLLTGRIEQSLLWGASLLSLPFPLISLTPFICLFPCNSFSFSSFLLFSCCSRGKQHSPVSSQEFSRETGTGQSNASYAIPFFAPTDTEMIFLFRIVVVDQIWEEKMWERTKYPSKEISSTKRNRRKLRVRA